MVAGQKDKVKNKPEAVRIALKVLEELEFPAKQELQGVLPHFAITLEKSGEKITEQSLKNYTEQGLNHIKLQLQKLKQQIKTVEQKTHKQKSIFQQYQAIIQSFPNHANTDVTQAIDYSNCYNLDQKLVMATLLGNLQDVKKFVEDSADIDTGDDWALRLAARCGHLDVVKFLVKNGADIHAQKDCALRWSARDGNLGIVKFLVKNGADIHAKKDYALRWSARRGNLDIVKFLVKNGADIHAKKDYALRWASLSKHFETAKFLVEQNPDTELAPKYQEEYKEQFQKIEKWEKIYGICPASLWNLSPYHFKPKAFTEIQKIIKKEGYNEKIANKYAYHATALFGTAERVLEYLKKWGKAGKQPLHDVVHHINIPATGRPNLKSWGDAVLKHGPKMAKLVKFAGKLPEPLKNTDGTWSYKKTRAEVAKHAFKNASENKELAALAMEHAWDEDDFENALKIVKKYMAKDKSKKLGRIPDIKIDGKKFGKEGYEFYKLPDGDLRGLFLGEYTNCCQHLASAGAECAEHGFSSKNGGFYVIEKQATGEIVAQSWAWRGKKGELVFDSLESLSGHFNAEKWQKLLNEFAKQVAENKSDITAINVGTGGNTPSGLQQKFKSTAPAKPKDYNGYRDSHTQLQVKELKK